MRAHAGWCLVFFACGAPRPGDARAAQSEPAIDIGAIVRFDDASAFATDDRAHVWRTEQLTELDRGQIAARVPRLRACYAAGLARDPRLAGSVDLVLAVDASGAVASIDTTTCRYDACADAADDAPPLDPPFADAAVVACMKDALRGVRFQTRPAHVHAPFELSPTL